MNTTHATVAASGIGTWLRCFGVRCGAALAVAWASSVAAQTVTVTPSSVPTPVQGVHYSLLFSASGGVAPYQFLVSTGSLPGGLNLAGNGLLAGTPTTAQAYGFTITISDALGREVDVVGSGAVIGALAVSQPPALHLGRSYGTSIPITGGVGPYTFTVQSGSLPPGMVLGPQGQLTGTPTTPGMFSVVVQVTDGSGQSVVVTLNFTVTTAAAIPVDSPWMLLLATCLLGWLGWRQGARRSA